MKVLLDTCVWGKAREALEREGWGIAADRSGDPTVTGDSLSSDFPVLDAIQASKRAGSYTTAIPKEP